MTWVGTRRRHRGERVVRENPASPAADRADGVRWPRTNTTNGGDATDRQSRNRRRHRRHASPGRAFNVAGVVTDERGAPMSGAVVTMAHWVGGHVAFPSVSTDATGGYAISFTANPLGNGFVARAQVVAEGYEEYWRSLMGTGGTTFTETFRLQRVTRMTAGDSITLSVPPDIGRMPRLGGRGVRNCATWGCRRTAKCGSRSSRVTAALQRRQWRSAASVARARRQPHYRACGCWSRTRGEGGDAARLHDNPVVPCENGVRRILTTVRPGTSPDARDTVPHMTRVNVPRVPD